MRRFLYLIAIVLSMGLMNSCLVDDETSYELNEQSPCLATFESFSINLGGLANGSEYTKYVKVKIVGPGLTALKDDITVTIAADTSSTAVEGDHYRLINPTLTLKAADNYLGLLEIVLMTEGNTPPMDGTPEFDAYKVPILILKIESATGDLGVTNTAKLAQVNINFTPPNPYAGDYDVELRYFHPTAGGSHPSNPPFNPDDPYGGIRTLEKTLIPITGRKCETGFAIWPETDICWITVNADNSITFEVWEDFGREVKLGDPYDPGHISHYDPATGIIYLYYYYIGAGGERIFWEVFTPKN